MSPCAVVLDANTLLDWLVFKDPLAHALAQHSKDAALLKLASSARLHGVHINSLKQWYAQSAPLFSLA